MPVVDLIPPQQVWACPNGCPTRIRTSRAGTNTPMHECGSHGGFRLPLVPEGERVGVRLVEREDYVGREDVQYADGRPVMRTEVERDDGHTDVWVYAPTAHAGGRAN